MAQDTDESRAVVVVNEPVAAAAIDAIIAATDVAVAASCVVVIVQVVDVVGVGLLARRMWPVICTSHTGINHVIC